MNDDHRLDTIEKLFQIGGAIVGGLVAAWGFLVLMRRRFSIACRAFSILCRLHDSLGPNADAQIINALEEGSKIRAELLLRMQLVERHLDIGVYLCDADGKCVFASSILCEQFGLDSQEMLGFGWSAVIPTKQRQRVVEYWQSCVSGGIPYSDQYEINNAVTGRHLRVITEAYKVEHDDHATFYLGWVKPKTE